MGSLPDDLDRLLHDLRGPLNALTMHLEVLKRLSRGDAGALQSLEAIHQEASRLATLLPAAFSVMALELRPPARLDLGGLVRRVVDAGHPGRVSVVEGTWPTVLGDELLLASAVSHLIRNALAATEAAGPGRRPPEVSFRPVGEGRVALVVRDWGVGLRTTNPRALIRLAVSASSGRPTLGLVTAERVARLHGGALVFGNPSEGGAEVSLLLPAAG
ncbi:MAG TPA: ATP-binding protein [Methylomirabilota bacterium]|nr:ATP-binding protein [Methylomirabilota bacterium]